jgi:predicted RND superfamily exporter protein
VVQVERPLIASGGNPLLARIFRRVIAWRWPIVIFWGLLTVPAGFFAAKVENDSSLDRIIVPNDPDFLNTHAFQQVFGRAEFAVLLIEADDPLAPEVIK